MKINLAVEDDDRDLAKEELHKLLDDIWNRYPKAIVEKTKKLPTGKRIEFLV